MELSLKCFSKTKLDMASSLLYETRGVIILLPKAFEVSTVLSLK
jgi:hypothetical protein